MIKQPIFIPMVLLLAVFVGQGCKQYTCECFDRNVNISKPFGYSNFQVKGTRDKAKQKCSANSTDPDPLGNYKQCEIK